SPSGPCSSRSRHGSRRRPPAPARAAGRTSGPRPLARPSSRNRRRRLSCRSWDTSVYFVEGSGRPSVCVWPHAYDHALYLVGLEEEAVGRFATRGAQHPTVTGDGERLAGDRGRTQQFLYGGLYRLVAFSLQVDALGP